MDDWLVDYPGGGLLGLMGLGARRPTPVHGRGGSRRGGSRRTSPRMGGGGRTRSSSAARAQQQRQQRQQAQQRQAADQTAQCQAQWSRSMEAATVQAARLLEESASLSAAIQAYRASLRGLGARNPNFGPQNPQEVALENRRTALRAAIRALETEYYRLAGVTGRCLPPRAASGLGPLEDSMRTLRSAWGL